MVDSCEKTYVAALLMVGKSACIFVDFPNLAPVESDICSRIGIGAADLFGPAANRGDIVS